MNYNNIGNGKVAATLQSTHSLLIDPCNNRCKFGRVCESNFVEEDFKKGGFVQVKFHVPFPDFDLFLKKERTTLGLLFKSELQQFRKWKGNGYSVVTHSLLTDSYNNCYKFGRACESDFIEESFNKRWLRTGGR